MHEYLIIPNYRFIGMDDCAGVAEMNPEAAGVIRNNLVADYVNGRAPGVFDPYINGTVFVLTEIGYVVMVCRAIYSLAAETYSGVGDSRLNRSQVADSIAVDVYVGIPRIGGEAVVDHFKKETAD